MSALLKKTQAQKIFDYKLAAKRLDQQIRQIFTLEKQLYDTRDRLDKEIVGLKNLQKLSNQILSAGFNPREVMVLVARHLIYEMNFEKALVFFSEEGRLKLGAYGGYTDKEYDIFGAAKSEIDKLINDITRINRDTLFDFRGKEGKNSAIKKFIQSFQLVYFLGTFLNGREGMLIGFILAGYSKEKTSTIFPEIIDEDVVLFSSLASQAALFIENSQINEILRQRLDELEEFHNLTVGRELKMIELKKETKRLREELAKS